MQGLDGIHLDNCGEREDRTTNEARRALHVNDVVIAWCAVKLDNHLLARVIEGYNVEFSFVVGGAAHKNFIVSQRGCDVGEGRVKRDRQVLLKHG